MTLAAWILALVGVLATAAIAWLLIPWAHKHCLVDRPSGRHDHGAPTPVVGGIAIWLGIAIIGLAGVGAVSRGFLAYLAAGAVLIGVGVLDDLRNLPWRLRLFFQALAALILFLGDAYARSVGNLLELGVWALPFSIFATIGVINAVNMIDGSDGLSGTLVGIALAFFAIEAVQTGDDILASQLLLMLGCVGGFLLLNLRFRSQRAARIFLGNSGSALLGLTIVWGAFELARMPGHSAAGILAPWVIAIPLIDCVVLIFRRLLARRSPFEADRNHIHHVLRDAGYTPQRIVVLAALLSISASSAAKLWLSAGWPELPLVLVFLFVIGIHFLWSGRREHAAAQLRREPRATYPRRAMSVSVPRDLHD
jgi:UDP-GlcNAc:undecaprenyl-phosphate GlcNAc-1-phosphate transferase